LKTADLSIRDSFVLSLSSVAGHIERGFTLEWRNKLVLNKLLQTGNFMKEKIVSVFPRLHEIKHRIQCLL
jgi:hypothetical protein